MKHLMYLIVGLSLALAACESKPAETAAETGATAEAPAEGAEEAPAEGETGADEGGTATEKVAVAAAGTEFDPPVEKAQIPDGAFICDMGTVHYARMEKGDGKCPLCGMMLKQHGEAPAAKDDGHDHDGHDHAHGDGHDHAH